MKLEKYSGNPILSPNPKQSRESLDGCNPGVICDQGTFHTLYRAAGNDLKHVIRFGLATCKDDFNFKPAQVDPVFSSSVDGEDAGCIDPRIVKINVHFLVTNAQRPYLPGKYRLAPNQSACMASSKSGDLL